MVCLIWCKRWMQKWLRGIKTSYWQNKPRLVNAYSDRVTRITVGWFQSNANICLKVKRIEEKRNILSQESNPSQTKALVSFDSIDFTRSFNDCSGTSGYRNTEMTEDFPRRIRDLSEMPSHDLRSESLPTTRNCAMPLSSTPLSLTYWARNVTNIGRYCSLIVVRFVMAKKWFILSEKRWLRDENRKFHLFHIILWICLYNFYDILQTINWES